MRIVQVSPYSWDVPGGVQAHVRQLAEQLRSHGHEVHILAPGKPPVLRPDARIVGRAVPVRGNGSVARICFSPQSAREVENVLREIRPDVIHVHEPLVPSTAMFAVLHATAAVVATFHSNVPFETTHSLVYRMGVPFVRPVWNRIDCRIAVSEAARDSVCARMGEAEFEIIPNGIDVTRFSSAKPLAWGPGRRLLFVGRLEPRKGFPVALRAFERVASGYPDLRLVVVGDGADRKAVTELPEWLQARVDMLGRVPDERLPGCFASADVFVSPALGGESFGIVLAEAMAAGLPVVASDIPGYRDVARHGREALLVPPDDDAALAAAIRRLLDEPALCESLGRRGRRRARDFSWDHVASALEQHYTRVARLSRRQRAAHRAAAG
ncbi:MAG TPA: glycosyltransferase family 4 protein [Gemmatimonadaceae bacterium]